MKNEQKEKRIGIKIGELNILIALIGILLILASINLYWTVSLANRLTPLVGETNGELRGEQPQGLPEQPTRIEVSVDDDPSVGAENAPITIVEFSDFNCPFCARAKPTIARILETYGDRVRLVFRDFPMIALFGPQSQKVSEAAECADEQGRFWEYHNMLFANQQALGDLNNLKKFAADLRLNTAKFNECLDSGKMAEEVEKDLRDGRGYGVEGTPAFFINGILVSGAEPYSVFEQIIEKELSQ